MKINVNVISKNDESNVTVLDNVTSENIASVMATFFATVGIHLAEELAPSRSKTLLKNGTLHMFDHAKLIDYKFQLESN